MVHSIEINYIKIINVNPLKYPFLFLILKENLSHNISPKLDFYLFNISSYMNVLIISNDKIIKPKMFRYF